MMKPMKKILALVVGLLTITNAIAQIPYFAGTVGDGKLYGYSSVKARPGINHQETYTTFQYGLGDRFATGIDLYTGPDCAYWGGLVRYGLPVSKWFNIGAEVIPSFNLNDSFKFAYLTSALYLNGALSEDGRLFWASNTWWGVKKDAANTFSNYEYIGYTFPLKQGRSITPMAGTLHSWKFDQDVDVAAGFYYTFGQWNLYVWGNDFLKDHPRFIVGLDFAL
jgi:hypothetical protein